MLRHKRSCRTHDRSMTQTVVLNKKLLRSGGRNRTRFELKALLLKESPKRIVINPALTPQPMNKLFGTNLRRLLNLLFLKARFQAGLFARVGDYVPRFRLQCLCPETTFPVSVCACIRSMVIFDLRAW